MYYLTTRANMIYQLSYRYQTQRPLLAAALTAFKPEFPMNTTKSVELWMYYLTARGAMI